MNSPPAREAPRLSTSPAEALQAELAKGGLADVEIAQFYAARAYAPLWFDVAGIRPEARQLQTILARFARDGLAPQAVDSPHLAALFAAAEAGGAFALAHAELEASRAYSAQVIRLRTTPPGARLAFTDPGFVPRPIQVGGVLEEAAQAPSLRAHLAAMEEVNPVFSALRAALVSYRMTNPTGANVRLIRANLERAKALPPAPGRRFILVDAARARLWLYEDGQPKAEMPVIVGKTRSPTPMMAGLVRYAMLNPYWNVPEDLVRDSIAPKALARGRGYFETSGFEALSSWTDSATLLDPLRIDWPSVAAGRTALRVRQRPGAANMMGAVKYMLPNPLGIYLHDTPYKALFRAADRGLSSGCIRLSDASALGRWLFGDGFVPPSRAGTNHRAELSEPVAVYITYLTTAPGPNGVIFSPDRYGWDRLLLNQMQDR